MELKVILIFFIACFSRDIYSQIEVDRSLGINILTVNTLDETGTFSEKSSITPGIVGNLFYHKKSEKNYLFGLNLGPSMGIDFNADSYGIHPSFVFEIPLSVQCFYQTEMENQLSGFFGLGYSYINNQSYLNYGSNALHLHGLLIETGISTFLNERKYTFKLKYVPKLNNFMEKEMNSLAVCMLYTFINKSKKN